MSVHASNRRFLLLAAVLATFMTGCATVSQPFNLTDSIARNPQLSTLSSMLKQSGLSETLKTSGPFTVFAPGNDAFKALPAKTMAELTANPEKLKAVLAFHVVPGTLLAVDIKNSNVKTVHGAMLAISKAGTFVTAENAAVTEADILATNGVVHIVDTVMLPPAK